MSRSLPCWISGVVLAAGLSSGCATRLAEPANLAPHKQQLLRYVDSGDYDRDLRAVANQAIVWIEQRSRNKRAGEQLCMVMDLDETLLLNFAEIRANDFGYIPAEWNKWVLSASAPAIEPIREVYRRT